MRRTLLSILLAILAVVPVSARGETNHGWAGRYGGNDGEDPYDVAVSPDGSRVYVTGSVDVYLKGVTPRASSDWATVAYDAETGEPIWAAEHDGPGGRYDSAYAVASTPDGATVLVAGQTRDDDLGDATVVAYDADDGNVRWVAAIDGPLDRTAELFDTLAVTPDGSTVIAVGNADTNSPSILGWYYELDVLIVALDVQTGAVRWESRHDGSGHDLDHATDVTVSSDGTLAAVAAQSVGSSGGMNALTMFMKVSDGDVLWQREFDSSYDVPLTVLFSPDDASLFVGGISDDDVPGTFIEKYATASGSSEWSRHVESRNYGETVLTLSPSADAVYVVGSKSGTTRGGWLISALNAADGSGVWTTSFGDYGSPVDVDPSVDGSVIVAGTAASDTSVSGFDIVTIALSPIDGSVRWVGAYDGGGADDRARALAVSPDGRRSFTVGESWGWPTLSFDYAVVAHGPGCANGSREEGPVSRPLDVLVEPHADVVHDINCEVVVPSGL